MSADVVILVKITAGEIIVNGRRSPWKRNDVSIVGTKVSYLEAPEADFLIKALDDNHFTVIDAPTGDHLYTGAVQYQHKRRIIFHLSEYAMPYIMDYVGQFSKVLNARLAPTPAWESTETKFNRYDLHVFSHEPRRPVKGAVLIINPEQTSRPNIFKELSNGILPEYMYVDYALYNIINLGKKGHLVEYQYDEPEISKLKALRPLEPTVDVVMVVTWTPRRDAICKALQARGVTVDFITGQVFHEDRDVRLMKGKLLVNVHTRDDFLMYESVRCDRVIMAGIPVITEDFIDEEVGMQSLLTIAPYKNLVQTVVTALENWEQFHADFRERCDRLLPGIISRRQAQMAEFLKELEV